MTFFNNKKHFLHDRLSLLESIGREGKDGGFKNYLNEIGIKTNLEYSDIEETTIDWNVIKNHHQFCFDYEGNGNDIKEWLKKCPISKYDSLITWLSWDDPIIRVRTTEFIANWEEFNITSGWDGLVMTTEDGKYFLEFTDDWNFHLNSNFEIKPNTKVSG